MVMVCTGIEMIGLVYCAWSYYTWTTVVSKITAECNSLVAYCMVRDDNQSKASRHFAQPSLSRFGEKNAKTKTNR